MKKFGKILAVASAAMLVVLSFAGCGNKTESGETTPANALEAVKAKGELVMVTNAEFPPFEYVKDGNIVGVDVDIANEIAKDLGVTLKIVDGKFDAVIPSIQSGKGNIGAAGITVRPDREEQVDFSLKYVTSKQYIILKNDSTIETIEDLAGKKIGVQLGTTGDLLISDEINGVEEDDGTHTKGVLEGSGATVVQANSAIDAAQDLVNGRIDAVVVDKLPAENISANQSSTKAIELVYADGSNTEEQYAFCVQKGNKELLEAVNKTLQRLIDAGKIDEYIVNHSK